MVGASIAGGPMLAAKAQVQGNATKSVDFNCDPDVEVCQQQTDDVVHSIISTSGTETVKVDPDKVTITIGVESQAITAQEATTKNGVDGQGGSSF